MSKIKICGLSRDCDINFVNEALPDYAGFVFAKSKRQVTAKRARELSFRLRKEILPVGVFVNAPIEEICSLCQDKTIRLVQLHGNESPTYIRELKKCSSVPIIKAFKIDETFDSGCLRDFDVDYFLFDNGSGGTGKSFDWNFLPKTEQPFFLAGGLCIENIKSALSLSPFALDLSSGVESDGKKDRNKILETVSIVKNQ